MIRATFASMSVCVFSIMIAGCGTYHGDAGPQGLQGERGADGPQGPPGFTSSPSTQSGERIKAVYLVADDGAKTPIGWLDADTGQRCSFEVAGDGFTRCLPVVLRSGLVRVFYASADCSGEAVAVGVLVGFAPCAPVGPYVKDTEHVACAAGVEVYSVGSKFVGNEPAHYSDGANCVANAGDKFDFFDVSRVEPVTFVGSSAKIQ